MHTCANSPCPNAFTPHKGGRPQRFCSLACQIQAKNRRRYRSDPERGKAEVHAYRQANRAGVNAKQQQRRLRKRLATVEAQA